MGTRRSLLFLALGVGTAFAQSGCKGCQREPPPVAPAPVAPAPVVEPPAPPTPVAAEEPPPSYPGPRSESLDGWRITTGFASEQDEARTEIRALELTRVYVTALDPGQHPVGRFDKFERGDLHAFLVAKDLRHALYSFALGPIQQGADARKIEFKPPEGGDHAMIAVFKPTGDRPRMISTPVAVKGVLPEVLGPGVESLGSRAKTATEDVLLTTEPATVEAGKPCKLIAHDLDPSGQQRGLVALPFALVANEEMGWGDVVEWGAETYGTWTPKWPGTYLVLAPPTREERALTWKIVVHPKGQLPPTPATATTP
jgi:hypothetical protein